MKLDFIDITNLKTSPVNVRKHGTVNGDDLIPSIRAMGVIQPLLVRPNCDGFEVVAGQRRLAACQALAREGELDPIPCAIMEDGDDAKAIEASLAENIQRLPMDEIDQYEAFRVLSKAGQSVEDIADHFGVTPRLVKQRLAIANLYTPILNAYRKQEIEAKEVRLLTMASTKQQKAWFKLFKDDEHPRAWQLKAWLFGGEAISTDAALFDLATYKGVIVSDLFEDERTFADPALFWGHQSRALAEIKLEFEDDGWSEVIVLDVGQSWSKWEHEPVAKEDGGKVFIEVRANGEVTIHEGLLSRKEAKRLQASADEQDAASERPELTKAMQSYLDHHRHAAVCVELGRNPALAMRVMLAKQIMQTEVRPRLPQSKAVAESLETNKATIARQEKREAVWEMLGTTDLVSERDYPRLTYALMGLDTETLLAKLIALSDAEIGDLMAFFAAENLDAGAALVEALGVTMQVEMGAVWEPDTTFFDLLRDKEAINAMVSEIAGEAVAKGNLTATAKTQKQIIQDCIKGENGMQAKPDWQPRYMAFPMQGYTRRQNTIEAVTTGESLKDRQPAS